MATNRIDSYFEPAVKSILAQTFTDFEFLILIDSTCGGVHAEIPEICRQDPRIRIIESPPLGGLAYALNMGIAAARGEFIARMDADDISKPDRLMEQVAYLDEHTDVDVLGSRILLIDSNSRQLERVSHYFQTAKQIRNVLPYRNPLFHPALIFRKEALLSVGGYKYGHYSEDHEMFIRMARDPNMVFHNLDKTLYEHRRHEGQGTNVRNMKKSYSEVSGFLLTEFIRTHSPKYLFGMLVVNPSIRKVKMALRKLRYGKAD